MNRLAILAALSCALGLSACDPQYYADLAVSVAPIVNGTVQSYATLNDATLAKIAEANPNDAKLQKVVASIRKGNAITATSANVIAAYAPAAGFVVDAGALVGRSIGDSVKAK